ncbi:MAG: type II secretion system F family protein [Armatimonadetes bacterium]|nr:type II secretion system F family protein [Armatimonadota bacterium]
MPLYRFQAVDAAGQPSGGTLDAPSPGHVAQTLAGRGLQVKSVSPVDQPRASLSVASPTAAASVNLAPPQQVERLRQAARVVEQSQQVQMRQVAPSRPGRVFRTGQVPNSALSFLFAQLATLWRSGVPPTTALTTLANQERRPALAQALRHMAEVTSERGSLAEAMAAYPDVFPEGAVGAMAAAETGGYVPDAAAELGERFKDAHRIGWGARLMRWEIIVIGFCGIPFAGAWVMGSRAMIEEMLNGTKANSVGDRLALLFSTALKSYFTSWPVWVLVVGLGTYFAVKTWAKLTRNRPMRHRLGLKLPVFGHFARQENLAVFANHLERLSAAGISPHQSWALASAAVPNIEFSRKLTTSLAGARDETPFGELVRRADVLGPDQANMIATGEMTGTLPDAFRHVAFMAAENAQAWRKGRLIALYVLATLITSVGITVALATFYGGWYSQVFESALKE